MPQVILVYANCISHTAKGDFALAANIAKDISRELTQQQADISVMLTSTLDGLASYHSLYSKPNHEGKLSIDENNIQLVALELFDSVQYQVVAFIEANRCKYAAAELVKRILSPTSKLLFVGAANQPICSDPTSYLSFTDKEQPQLYPYFNHADIHVLCAGLGEGRVGLPQIKKTTEYPKLLANADLGIPELAYGFMYFASIDKPSYIKMITQFMQLTQHKQYVLVGNFAEDKALLSAEVSIDFKHESVKPSIHYYPSLKQQSMRQVAAQSGILVGCTGTMSTLELMHDGKLPFYQNYEQLSNNANFIASYLIAVKQLCQQDDSLVGKMPDLIIRLSTLLFDEKPLALASSWQLQDMLTMENLTRNMVSINHQIVDKANGKIANQLLSFIGRASQTSRHTQYIKACQNLRKPEEKDIPLIDQALRRAAAWGQLFELKVLMQAMSKDDLNKADIQQQQRTALHWAVISEKFDCAALLITSGVNLDCRDKQGKTPLRYAVLKENREMIRLLINAGASLTIEDCDGHLPCAGAKDEMLGFISSCQVKQVTAAA